jgi:hypothetical protein
MHQVIAGLQLDGKAAPEIPLHGKEWDDDRGRVVGARVRVRVGFRKVGGRDADQVLPWYQPHLRTGFVFAVFERDTAGGGTATGGFEDDHAELDRPAVEGDLSGDPADIPVATTRNRRQNQAGD